jgi:hypothetical protein
MQCRTLQLYRHAILMLNVVMLNVVAPIGLSYNKPICSEQSHIKTKCHYRCKSYKVIPQIWQQNKLERL